jgi:hypothetical protein
MGQRLSGDSDLNARVGDVEGDTGHGGLIQPEIKELLVGRMHERNMQVHIVLCRRGLFLDSVFAHKGLEIRALHVRITRSP